VNKWVLLGTFFRNFGGSVTTYYLPVFFLKCFSNYKVQYSFVNSVILSVVGLASGIIGGVIADKYEKNSYLTKAWICILGSAAAIPLIGIATMQPSFWVSMVCFTLFTLLASAFSGPAITMMQNTTQKSLQGSIISSYFFTITIAQTMGPLFLDLLAKKFGALTNPLIYGPLITISTLIGFGGSVPCWWKAGQNYKRIMTEKAEKEKLALAA
jgi:MFS family permease